MIFHQFFRNNNRGRIFNFQVRSIEKQTLDIKTAMHHNIDLLFISSREEQNPFFTLKLDFPERII